MGRYIRVEADVPGLERLEELIDEHKRLIDALEINLHDKRMNEKSVNTSSQPLVFTGIITIYFVLMDKIILYFI